MIVWSIIDLMIVWPQIPYKYCKHISYYGIILLQWTMYFMCYVNYVNYVLVYYELTTTVELCKEAKVFANDVKHDKDKSGQFYLIW